MSILLNSVERKHDFYLKLEHVDFLAMISTWWLGIALIKFTVKAVCHL